MTQVYYDRPNGRVSISGHAGAGTAGNDLVCAGLSALARVLLLAAEKHGGTALEGDASVVVSMDDKKLLDSVCDAFRWMAEEYPMFVAFDCRDVG